MARVTGQLAELAATAAGEAQRLLANARQAVRRAKAKAAELRERGVHDAAAGRRRGRLARAVNDLQNLLEATRQVVAQTRQRVAGSTPDGATRRVSLHDGDARPIAKGRRWGARWSSGRRPRSSTTTTGSCSIILWSRAIRPTRRNWLPR